MCIKPIKVDALSSWTVPHCNAPLVFLLQLSCAEQEIHVAFCRRRSVLSGLDNINPGEWLAQWTWSIPSTTHFRFFLSSFFFHCFFFFFLCIGQTHAHTHSHRFAYDSLGLMGLRLSLVFIELNWCDGRVFFLCMEQRKGGMLGWHCLCGKKCCHCLAWSSQAPLFINGGNIHKTREDLVILWPSCTFGKPVLTGCQLFLWLS